MNNKTTLSLLGGALLTGTAFAGQPVAPVVETEPCFEASVTVGAHSDYVFRGAHLGTELVDAAVDVSTSAWGLDFTGGAWYGSYDNSGTNEDELNLYLDASKDFDFVRATVGYIWYDVDSGAETTDTAEFYFGLSKDLCHGVSTSLTYFLDVSGELSGDEGDNDGYSVWSVEKSDLFLEGVTLSNDLGYSVEKGRLTHDTASLSYDYAITENATLAPYLAYTWELDYHSTYGDEKNRFHGGVALSVSF